MVGLAPTWVLLKRLSDGSDVLPRPAIAEIGQGLYGFAYDPERLGEACGQIDAGPAVTTPADRFIDVAMYLESSRIVTAIDSQGRVRLAPTPLFLGSDSTTQGNWMGAYGRWGYHVLGDGEQPHYPSYAKVTASGCSSYTWNGNTSDVRALSRPSTGGTGRIAGCWYAGTPFLIDVNLTDGVTHRVTLYAVDWEPAFRSQKIEVLDPSSGCVLDSRAIDSFSGGIYLSWNLNGHVQLRITCLKGVNAVVSGLFFDAAG